jgi:hypothetical protein
MSSMNGQKSGLLIQVLPSNLKDIASHLNFQMGGNVFFAKLLRHTAWYEAVASCPEPHE